MQPIDIVLAVGICGSACCMIVFLYANINFYTTTKRIATILFVILSLFNLIISCLILNNPKKFSTNNGEISYTCQNIDFRYMYNQYADKYAGSADYYSADVNQTLGKVFTADTFISLLVYNNSIDCYYTNYILSIDTYRIMPNQDVASWYILFLIGIACVLCCSARQADMNPESAHLELHDPVQD